MTEGSKNPDGATTVGWYPEPAEITEIELLQKQVARLGLDTVIH